MLKNELDIRAVFQPNKASLSVIGFKADEDLRKKIKDSFKCEEVLMYCCFTEVKIITMCIAFF
jgi:hypothetical protein